MDFVKYGSASNDLAKNRLQEIYQRMGASELPKYTTQMDPASLAHVPRFISIVSHPFWNGRSYTGYGSSKKEAEKAAALIALQSLENNVASANTGTVFSSTSVEGGGGVDGSGSVSSNSDFHFKSKLFPNDSSSDDGYSNLTFERSYEPMYGHSGTQSASVSNASKSLLVKELAKRGSAVNFETQIVSSVPSSFRSTVSWKGHYYSAEGSSKTDAENKVSEKLLAALKGVDLKSKSSSIFSDLAFTSELDSVFDEELKKKMDPPKSSFLTPEYLATHKLPEHIPTSSFLNSATILKGGDSVFGGSVSLIHTLNDEYDELQSPRSALSTLLQKKGEEQPEYITREKSGLSHVPVVVSRLLMTSPINRVFVGEGNSKAAAEKAAANEALKSITEHYASSMKTKHNLSVYPVPSKHVNPTDPRHWKRIVLINLEAAPDAIHFQPKNDDYIIGFVSPHIRSLIPVSDARYPTEVIDASDANAVDVAMIFRVAKLCFTSKFPTTSCIYVILNHHLKDSLQEVAASQAPERAIKACTWEEFAISYR